MATPTEDLASFNGLDAEEEDLNMQLADSEDHEEILKQEIAKSATKANFTHRRSLSTQGTAVGGTSLVIDTNVNVVQQRRIAGTPLKHSVYTTTSTITGSPSKTSSSSSMTPNSANALGVFGRYLGKKRESVSFFLNLGSPIKKQPELDKVYESEEENDTSPRKGVPPTSYQDMSLESKVPEIKKRPAISFPPIKGYTNRLPAGQMKELLEKKLRRASIARDRLLDERKESLRRYAESIRMKQLILDSRQRLDKLRLEAQLEYNMSSATLNRQIIIRKKRDFFARKVEHSKRVMLLQKMKSFMELRRAISESFVDLIKQDNDPNFPSEFETRVPNPFGLKLQIEQPSSSSDAESEGTVTKDRDLRNMTNAMENTFLFEESPTMTRKETLSAAIRRTKSVPQFVLRSSGSTDTTFLELLNLLPPITRFTLRELDMNEILGNAQLRHDLVFDPDLQFRASEEDDDESKKANSYWDEIRAEVADGQLYRIPLLLAEVRAILVELLPNGQETKKEIFSNIDVNLIDQEISHGIMDPTNLILYLSNSMKTNCAPIRDVLVDEMVSKCKEGDITSTLKLCFEILEYMKLVLFY